MILQTANNICSNYKLNKPVKFDKSLTQYAKMIMFVYNSNQTSFKKVEILEAVGFNFKGSTKATAGWCTNQLAMLNLNDLIVYNPSTRKLEAGKNLNEYVHTYILPKTTVYPLCR